ARTSYAPVGASPSGPTRHRPSERTVSRAACIAGSPGAVHPKQAAAAGAVPSGIPAYAPAPFIEPPTVRRLVALRREAFVVTPSAWNHENIGFRSSPLNGVKPGLSMMAKSLPRFAR